MAIRFCRILSGLVSSTTLLSVGIHVLSNAAYADPRIEVTYDSRPVGPTSRVNLRYSNFPPPGYPTQVTVLARHGLPPGDDGRHLNLNTFPVAFGAAPQASHIDFPVPSLNDGNLPHLITAVILAETHSGQIVKSPFIFINPRLPDGRSVEIRSGGGTTFRANFHCDGGNCEIGRYLLKEHIYVRNRNGGAVTFTSISPTPDITNGCNGYAIDPVPSQARQSFSSAVARTSTLSYVVPPPLSGGLHIPAGTEPKSLVLSKALCPAVNPAYPTDDAAVITIVRDRPSATMLRPSFPGGNTKQIADIAAVNLDRMPRLHGSLTVPEFNVWRLHSYRAVPLIGRALVHGYQNQFLIPRGGVFSPYGPDIAKDLHQAAAHLAVGDVTAVYGKERLLIAYLQESLDNYQGILGGMRQMEVGHQLGITVGIAVSGAILNRPDMMTIGRNYETGETSRMRLTPPGRSTSHGYNIMWNNGAQNYPYELDSPLLWNAQAFTENSYRIASHGPSDRAGAALMLAYGFGDPVQYPEWSVYIQYAQGRLPSENLRPWNELMLLNPLNRTSTINSYPFNIFNLSIASVNGGSQFMQDFERMVRAARLP